MTKSKSAKTAVSAALKIMPGKIPPGQKELLKAMCEDIAPEDLALLTPSDLAEMSKSHWGLAQSRKPGQDSITIYCPASKSIKHRKTVIDIVSDDHAFLIDSVAAEINKHNLLIDFLAHPTVYNAYDENGKIKKTSTASGPGLKREAHLHIHIKEILAQEALEELEAGLRISLKDVAIANKDWKAMLEELENARKQLARAQTRRSLKEVEKHCAFLEYLHDNNFTLLGYREYQFYESKSGELKSRVVKNSSLGLLHDDVRPAYINEHEEGLPHNLQELRKRLPPVSVSKTNRVSTVHRRVPMDAIAVKVYNDKGDVVGEKLFLGLFTSVTYSRSVSDVPYLREKVDDVIHMSGFIQGSHDRKAMRHVLEKYPRDELFQISTEDLYKTVLNIIRLQERQRIALFTRCDPFGRYVSCLIYIPRDRFETSLRIQMGKILERELNGTISNLTVSMDDAVFARIMFTINVDQKSPPKFDSEKLEKLLRQAGQAWPERLSLALDDSHEDEAEITRLTLKYGHAFPVEYMQRYRAKQSVFDIDKMEQALETGQIALDLYRPDSVKENQLRLKIYNSGAPVTLSDIMPILENMGLWAIAELPYEIKPKGEKQSIWIHDFLLETPASISPVDLKNVKVNFEKAFVKTWYKELENDSLNRLVLAANTNWHEIMIMRAYVRYMKQIRIPFSRPYIENTLTENPKIGRMIVDLFKALHNPANGKKSAAMAQEIRGHIRKALEKVESLDQDRILTLLSALVEATLRTNYFQRQADGAAKPYLSLKLDSGKIKELPSPKPFREIFVYAPNVEGIHLRGDKIARGGIRWSDRHEDFRTEVLGLMKAQMVKNAVIVPMGAKGGFVVKTPTSSREEFREAGIECYKTFIRGLLDITDNMKGNKVVPPHSVVRRDGDDPYLVVAADKGTATFSDIANSLSQEYGFWMDDAFASGGSAGYDHKKMGITARGAWESVKAHFRQLNHNIQEKAFDVTGVGDMGGDVFGNGMLLSEHICLIGAFNHLHIFCDPNPDPASSFKERKRLFDEVKGWDQYNEKLLSKGGRIYSRADKVLKLTPEIMQRFDLENNEVSPQELMHAILRARTDLLWFGGIGTYIKSSRESDADAGDKANDAIRLNGRDVRAKVIGEGANLGVTQLGRIEFAEHGGRINTDFVDNSGGVNSSDLEVNIKILMSDVMQSKAHNMNLKSRNKLLSDMTDDIAAQVLRNNYQQAQAISLAEVQAAENLQIHDDFISDLERENGLNRVLEGLPDSETVELRLRTGKGLTRPELCVLVSHAKIALAHQLLKCDIPDTLDLDEWLLCYFPAPLRKKYAKEINDHRLKREIICTTMANSLINRMGPTLLKSLMGKTGASIAEVARAYLLVRDAFGLRKLWDAIEALDNQIPADVQLRAMREIARLAEHAITWFLTRLGRPLDLNKDVISYGNGIAELRQNFDTLLTDELMTSVRQHQEAWQRDGLPKALARDIALMPALSSACDIIRISLENKSNLPHTAGSYFELGEYFHMDWLRQQARYLNSEDHWHAQATAGLVDQLYSCQAILTVRVLKDSSGTAPKGEYSSLAQHWLARQEQKVKQLNPLFASLRRAGTVDLPMLVIAEQRLRQLAEG